jgi:hypothetical protein
MNKREFRLLSLLLVSAPLAHASDDPCALVEKFGKATQVIPKKGAVQTRFESQAPVSCGSMIITHGDGFWIRYSNQVMVKIGPHSFYEVGKSVSDVNRVYRGDVLVSGPAGSGDMTFTTPNGEVHFEGGVFTVQYQTESRTTSVASFNRAVDFKNKFNTRAFQKVNVGEISRLTIHDIRVVPTQPVAMSPSSVKEAMVAFDLPDAERDEMVAIVARVFENRAKSLVSELENFKDIPEGKVDNRSPASLGRYQPAVDEKEEEFTMKVLRRRLYNDDQELEKKTARRPASQESRGAVRIDDSGRKKTELKKKETDRVLKEISSLDTEE